MMCQNTRSSGRGYFLGTIIILRLSLGFLLKGAQFQRRPGAPCPDLESCQIMYDGDVTAFCGILSTARGQVDASEAYSACAGDVVCAVM